MSPGKIVLEEAFIMPSQVERFHTILRGELGLAEPLANALVADLASIHDKRLERMDELGIEFCVLSLSAPGPQALTDPKAAAELARTSNDWVAAEVKKKPTRFGAFAALSMHDPHEAAAELTRCVKELGFVGALVNNLQLSPSGPLFYDTPAYDPFWSTCVALDVPLYLHPGLLLPETASQYAGRKTLVGPAHQFARDVSLHVLGMVTNGVFDRWPGLKIVLGHMGETIPFDTWRIGHRLQPSRFPPNALTMSLPFRHYLSRNIFLTTSGQFSSSVLSFCLTEVGADNILFSVDYPYETFEEGCEWWDSVEPLMNAKDYEKITRGNAIQLLKLDGVLKA